MARGLCKCGAYARVQQVVKVGHGARATINRQSQWAGIIARLFLKGDKMKIERICTFEENELNAMKTIARINCDAISCDECPLNDTLRKMCTRALCRQVLEEQNIDY